jgi:hypothetical protein
VVSCRLTPGEITLHSNKDRHICIKTHAKASPEINTWLTSKSTPKGLIITNRSLWHDNKIRSFENSGIKLNDARNITEGLPWCLHSSYSTHSSSQLGGISPSHTSAKALPGTTDYSKAEYTNTQQDLPVGDNYITNSRHERLLATGVSFAEKKQRVCPYFQDFSISSSWLLFSKLASSCKHKLCKTINQAHIFINFHH